MIKTVLYATDLSRQAVSELRYAYHLTSGLKADLTVLHVYQIPPISVSTIRPKELIKKRAFEEQMNLARSYCSKHLTQQWNKTNVKIQVLENTSISKGILAVSEKLSPDLIVVGMKDEHTERGFFSGSIAKALLDKTKWPILIIPGRLRYRRPKTLVYATDFEDTDILAVKKLAAIAKPFNAKIRIVHVPTVEEYIGKKQQEAFKKKLRVQVVYKDLEFHTYMAHSVYEGLMAFIREYRADALAMLERQHKEPFKKLFHKDLVKKMETHIGIPLLSFNQRYL